MSVAVIHNKVEHIWSNPETSLLSEGAQSENYLVDYWTSLKKYLLRKAQKNGNTDTEPFCV